MTFKISTLAESLASHLAPVLPVTFYQDPRQQKTDLPCAFIQLISSDVKYRMGGRLLRELRFDLTYLDNYNLPDLQRRYQAASEVLDLNMEKFSYSDGEDTTLLRTHDRSAQIDLDGLHYKFSLRFFMTPYEDEQFMRQCTLEVRLRYGEKS